MKLFSKALCFVLVLKLASCKPVVDESATATYDDIMNTDSMNNDDEEHTGYFITPGFGDEDQLGDFSGDDVIATDEEKNHVIATDEEYSHKKFSEMFILGDGSDELPIWAEEAIWKEYQDYDEEEFLTGWGH